MSVSSPVAVNEQGDVLSSGSEKSSSSRNVLSSFRRPSAASLSSSSLAPKSFSSMPASDQALQECREPRQEGESDRLAGRHRRSCRNRVLSESFPSPLLDALVHALIEKYADPEGLVGLLTSRCTPTRIQHREDECSHLPDSVSSSASLPSPALHLGRPHDEEPDAHACRQAQTGGSNAERLQPAVSAQPPRRDRRTTPRESNETRSATLLLSSCPVFVLLRALVNRLCERAASSEACNEEGMDSSHSDAATRREGHRGVVLSATLSARDAANLGGGNRGSKEGGQGDPSCQGARGTCATSQSLSSHGSATTRPRQGALIGNVASPASPRSHCSFLASSRRPRPAESVVECLGLPLASLFCIRPLLRKEAQKSLDLLAGESACRLAQIPSEASRTRRFTSVERFPVSCGGSEGPRSDKESSSGSGGDAAFTEIPGPSTAPTQVERCLFSLQKLASKLPFSSTVEWQSACVAEGLLPVLPPSSSCDGSGLCSNASLGTCWGLGDSSYGATGRGDSARAKVGERGDRNALLDDLGKRRMMHTEEEDVGEGLCVEQAEDFLKMCLSLHAPRRTFTLNAFPGPQETEDDDGEVQEVGGSSASARRSAGLKSDGRPCEDAAHPTSGTSAFTSFPFLQYFWDAENMPSSQAWALRQARPVFVNARQEASFYLTVSSAANELLSVFVTSQERKAKALLVGLASRQLATRSRQPGCGAGRVSVAHSLSPRKATKDLQVSRAEGCEEGEDLGDDDGGRRTTPLSPHDLKAHLLLYICGNNELNTTWRHLGARLLFTLPATNLATLRDVLPVQNPRHERCLSGALSCHELVSLLFRFFAPFADETAERKETRSQTRRLFNHEELEEKRENPKTKQQVQPIQLLTVLGLVATSATLCDPGAPHALRVVALLSLQNVRPPGGKRLSPSLLSSLSVTSSLSSSFPASYHVGRRNLRGLSTAALSRHAEPGRAEDESEPANELEIEDVERLARMIGCASPSMALITSTVAQISREDDAPALLNL
ncbi:hypothetical protein TGGT1_408630 [Toxoplasma gondii GT1]|uniref:Uncharacterized protein n=1 Tax=Toxoplasma gondii (strain ATCC 50853 / GT1) TaxID=507601 RepID=S7V0L7_TOXGG|nr:hypothetical protein TGGT1_408630 [Toxoplasma gondii GT1]